MTTCVALGIFSVISISCTCNNVIKNMLKYQRFIGKLIYASKFSNNQTVHHSNTKLKTYIYHIRHKCIPNRFCFACFIYSFNSCSTRAVNVHCISDTC